MRSLLFVPGDSASKAAKALGSDADALILDLEDSVAASEKDRARGVVRDILDGERQGKRIYVRINALDTDMTLADLAAIMPGRPAGILLPKSEGADDVARLGYWLDAFEATHATPPSYTRILAIATETAASLFGLASYREAGPRLEGLLWGAEDLAASIGSLSNRDGAAYNGPSLMARNMCLVAAAAAGVMAIDAVFTGIRDLDGLSAEADAGRRDGFNAKAVIHPSHIAVVNAVFTPSDREVAWAREVTALFATPAAGALSLNGQMIDKPHLRMAERILAQVPHEAARS